MSLPDWIIRVDAASARHVRDRIRKPLGEAFLLRVVMRAESLVSDVRARDQVVLGRRDRKELTESFSMFLDEAGRPLAVRSGTIMFRPQKSS